MGNHAQDQGHDQNGLFPVTTHWCLDPLKKFLSATYPGIFLSDRAERGICARNRAGRLEASPRDILKIAAGQAPAMRVLVACEYSGTVRNAFLDLGHDAWSCDLLPSEDGSNRHIVGDARDLLNDGWDLLMVAHPPCTRLCNSGVRWLTVPPRGKTVEEMWAALDEGAALFSDFWNAPIDRIAIENPVMHKHAKIRIVNFQDFAQSIQPWQFGHGETKRTCLWLKNLPPLIPTSIVSGRAPRVHRMPPSPDRWKERSRFFPGIAKAMAEQWSAAARP